MFSDALTKQAEEVLAMCRRHQRMIATAESCTGGLLSALLTEIAGSSDVFERGFVSYSNAAKKELLGVSESLLEQYGAVSAEVAVDMALGALKHSAADIAISITGIAGPGGGTPTKPVGLVYIGLAGKIDKISSREYRFQGNRSAIRMQTVQAALASLMEHLTHSA